MYDDTKICGWRDELFGLLGGSGQSGTADGRRGGRCSQSDGEPHDGPIRSRENKRREENGQPTVQQELQTMLDNKLL